MKMTDIDLKNNNQLYDHKLSKREIKLDPRGYFIIKVDLTKKLIIVEYYLNNIDNRGLAVDPVTNRPIECNQSKQRKYNKIFSGHTAKELGILITEKEQNLLSKFDHALYLGRELQKAEECILNNSQYIQD